MQVKPFTVRIRPGLTCKVTHLDVSKLSQRCLGECLYHKGSFFVKISNKVDGYPHFDTLIHELIHACCYDLAEYVVEEISIATSKLLWNFGWRHPEQLVEGFELKTQKRIKVRGSYYFNTKVDWTLGCNLVIAPAKGKTFNCIVNPKNTKNHLKRCLSGVLPFVATEVDPKVAESWADPISSAILKCGYGCLLAGDRFADQFCASRV